jgi:hypothetical protein
MSEATHEMESLVAPERMVNLLHQIDRWTTRPSAVFPGYLEILKTRKTEDQITVHINPEEGKVRKFAGRSLYNPKIQKEAEVWNIALNVFNTDEKVSLGFVKQLKADPSRGWEKIAYIEMPYLGLPLSYFEELSPKSIPKQARDEFTQNMKRMVMEHGILHPDLNYENVLVRIQDGQIKLLPIDWESADKRKAGIGKKTDYYISVQIAKCDAIFAKFYPNEYEGESL